MNLQPTPYHLLVRDHFKQQSKTWDFFAAAKNREDQLIQYKTELLKNTYKFDPVSDAAIYEKIETAKAKLGLEQLPVVIYQAQYTDELNASIVFIQNEAHIVFSGRIKQLLDEEELLTVIAHELTHVKLFSMQSGDLEIADRIISSIANNYNSDAAYYETARLFRLYTEIFCDRGAYLVSGNIAPVITALVKVATGLDKVSAESYLKQAADIFSLENNTKVNTLSHPENFIRARALQLWHEKQEAAEEEIAKLIQGLANLDQLDIFKQKEIAQLTREFLQLYLKPKWFRSTMVVSQAKQYFNDFYWNDTIVLEAQWVDKLRRAHQSLKDYFAYVLLDFALLDSTLEEIPFGWAFQFAEAVELKESFDAAVKKELKLSDKKLQQHRQKVLSAYYEVKEGEADQIYEG